VRKKRKESFGVPDQNALGSGTFFNWPKATVQKGLLTTSSGLQRGRKMAIYLQKIVIFVFY
jgi:hypothetical protein